MSDLPPQICVEPNYIEFIEVMGASDYFRLAGVTKEFLYSLWPTTYEGVFRAVMDDYAARHGARYWVEKSPSHSVMVNQLATFYPDAKFVSVLRKVEEVAASAMVLRASKAVEYIGNKRLRRLAIIRNVLSWTYYNKVLGAFRARSESMLIVRYEMLQSDLTATLQQVCSFLDLPYESCMSEQEYAKNTSFRNQVERSQALSDGEVILVRLLARLFDPIPLYVLSALDRMRNVRRKSELPSWFFLQWSFPGGKESE